MTTFDELGTFEYTTYDDQEGDGLPRVNWHNGDKKTKVPGDFYTKADAWMGDLPAPWVAADRFDDEPGWAAPKLMILPITYRQQAFITVKQGDRKRREYLDKWVEGASIHTEILCMVQGLEGPVVWSIKGSTGKAVTGKGGIFPTARTALVSEAQRRLKKKVPMHAFWLPVAAQIDAKTGKTFFLEFAEGGSASPPALHLPKTATTEELLNTLYAGRQTIEDASALREEYEEWRHVKKTNDRDEDGAPPAPAPAGKNAPQAYDPAEDFSNDDVL